MNDEDEPLDEFPVDPFIAPPEGWPVVGGFLPESDYETRLIVQTQGTVGPPEPEWTLRSASCACVVEKDGTRYSCQMHWAPGHEHAAPFLGDRLPGWPL